jgi:hypothetical protein
MQFRPAVRRAAKAAIAARKNGGDDGEQLFPAGSFARHPLLNQHGTLAFALVQDGQHAFVGDHFAFGRQRLVDSDAALAIHDKREIDLRFLRHALAFGRRLTAIDDAGESGHHLQPVILIDEGQFLFVQRIAPHAHAQGIKHHILFVIARARPVAPDCIISS